MDEVTIPLLTSVSGSIPDLEPVREGATFTQTLFNVINIFVGLGLLSTPYAYRAGGYIAGVALLLLSSLFCLSGHLIVAAFQYLPVDAPRSFPQLGKHALGIHGRKVVAVVAFLELFGGACMALLVTWQQLLILLDNHGLLALSPVHTAVALSLLWLVPMLSVGGFSRLAILSKLGMLSVCIVVTVVYSLLVLDPSRDDLPQPPPGHALARWTLPQAVGIFAVSLSGHSTLPALRAGMAAPSRFPALLTAAFCVMALLYGTVGAMGYWYYGSTTSALITTDISRAGPWTDTAMDKLLACLLLVNCSTKYPALVLVLQARVDLIIGMFPSKVATQGQLRPAVLATLRMLLCAASVGLSYAALDSIACVMSLVGGVASLSCSLLMPTLFYVKLAWAELGAARRGALLALLGLGSALMVFITSQNVVQLLAQLGKSTGA
ncbi:Vacuolar amino acid transporter 1 [Auxenochlorella protothecoides]|uniref:Vacuolar amino acid transporter 1 n=1 Tax=Auxenochlorella protothecoides TaxID=3075 RepID=A0A087SP93_AUXPR|nr:Vacuolar amino acid transporter 1 [Auxenochlorella protothecoides]KFM27547.1 Vacuolar amino acid transporter 1 [Auxenochlorella protothecoides]